MSCNHLQQDAAVYSLSTLMSIIPGHTYAEFEKVDFISVLQIIVEQLYWFIWSLNLLVLFNST